MLHLEHLVILIKFLCFLIFCGFSYFSGYIWLFLWATALFYLGIECNFVVSVCKYKPIAGQIEPFPDMNIQRCYWSRTIFLAKCCGACQDYLDWNNITAYCYPKQFLTWSCIAYQTGQLAQHGQDRKATLAD